MGFTKDKDKSEEETNSKSNEKNAKKNQENEGEKRGGGSDDKKKEIENCENNLLFSAKKISNSPLGAVKKKYISEKFLNVAKLCEVTINDVE